MPLYEYQCESCSHRFERIQKFSDPPVDACPQCGSAVRKLISSPAIQFKGSGFYITDYGKSGGGSGKAESSEAKGDSKSDKTEKKSETASKPDAAPAASPKTE